MSLTVLTLGTISKGVVLADYSEFAFTKVLAPFLLAVAPPFFLDLLEMPN